MEWKLLQILLFSKSNGIVLFITTDVVAFRPGANEALGTFVLQKAFIRDMFLFTAAAWAIKCNNSDSSPLH